MARFDLSGFAPAADQPDLGAIAPPPAADPIDTIRINGALNDFLAAKQDALFDAPDAFYRTTGRQRRGSQIPGVLAELIKRDIPGGRFVQRPQFRSVSNFNVGLFSQQVGLDLETTLWLAKLVSKTIGRTDPSQPYELKAKTAEFIRKGYEAGARGAFGSPGSARGPTGR